MKKVSIIIPVYNAEKYLTETLDCAIQQTWSNKEVIVVNDGSQDKSLAIAHDYQRRFPYMIQVYNQENLGGNVARDRGIAKSSGDYLQFLDADDLMAPDKIESQMNVLIQEPPTSICFGPWHRFVTAINDLPLHPVSTHWKSYSSGLAFLLQKMEGKIMTPVHSWLVPRLLIERAGGWNRTLTINQDGEFFNRVLLKSSKVLFVPNATVYYRSLVEGSISRKPDIAKIRSLFHSLQLIEEEILLFEDSPQTRQALSCMYFQFAYHHYPTFAQLTKESLQKVSYLGGNIKNCQFKGKKGGKVMVILTKVLGWKAAKRIRSFLKFN